MPTITHHLGIKSAAVTTTVPIKWTVDPVATGIAAAKVLVQNGQAGYGLYKPQRMIEAAAALGVNGDAGKIVTTSNAIVIFPDITNGKLCFATITYEAAT